MNAQKLKNAEGVRRGTRKTKRKYGIRFLSMTAIGKTEARYESVLRKLGMCKIEVLRRLAQ